MAQNQNEGSRDKQEMTACCSQEPKPGGKSKPTFFLSPPVPQVPSAQEVGRRDHANWSFPKVPVAQSCRCRAKAQVTSQQKTALHPSHARDDGSKLQYLPSAVPALGTPCPAPHCARHVSSPPGSPEEPRRAPLLLESIWTGKTGVPCAPLLSAAFSSLTGHLLAPAWPPLLHSSSVGPMPGFSPRDVGLEDGVHPEAEHPSPGLVEVPSWLLRGTKSGGLRASWGAQPPAPAGAALLERWERSRKARWRDIPKQG